MPSKSESGAFVTESEEGAPVYSFYMVMQRMDETYATFGTVTGAELTIPREDWVALGHPGSITVTAGGV